MPDEPITQPTVETDNSAAEPVVTTDPAETKLTEQEEQVAKAQAELTAIEEAKASALAELQRIRTEKRAEKKAPTQDPEPQPTEALEIDMNDPGSQLWDKHIKDTVSPIVQENERGKAEVREFALKQFLDARPALAKNSSKLKELMDVYERIHTASERTPEGVLMDLDKAYAVVYHQELLDAAQQQRVERVRNDAIFADPAVSRGATSYSAPKDQPVKLSNEEQAILAKWGMSPNEWNDMRKAQIQKENEAV